MVSVNAGLNFILDLAPLAACSRAVADYKLVNEANGGREEGRTEASSRGGKFRSGRLHPDSGLLWPAGRGEGLAAAPARGPGPRL